MSSFGRYINWKIPYRASVEGGSGQIEHSTHWILSIKVDWSLLFTAELRVCRFLKNVRKCFGETQGKHGAGPTDPAVAKMFVILWTVEVDLLGFWFYGITKYFCAVNRTYLARVQVLNLLGLLRLRHCVGKHVWKET